jgi:hypothetical protein
MVDVAAHGGAAQKPNSRDLGAEARIPSDTSGCCTIRVSCIFVAEADFEL